MSVSYIYTPLNQLTDIDCQCDNSLKRLRALCGPCSMHFSVFFLYRSFCIYACAAKFYYLIHLHTYACTYSINFTQDISRGSSCHGLPRFTNPAILFILQAYIFFSFLFSFTYMNIRSARYIGYHPCISSHSLHYSQSIWFYNYIFTYILYLKPVFMLCDIASRFSSR